VSEQPKIEVADFAGMVQRDAMSAETWFKGPSNAAARAIRDRRALIEAYSACRAELERLERLVYVPGLWRCAKCRCHLTVTNIHVASGQFSAGTEPQQCPNGCGPMWRVTEREAGNQLVDRLEAAVATPTTRYHGNCKTCRCEDPNKTLPV
jgi:hypothetical protein